MCLEIHTTYRCSALAHSTDCFVRCCEQDATPRFYTHLSKPCSTPCLYNPDHLYLMVIFIRSPAVLSCSNPTSPPPAPSRQKVTPPAQLQDQPVEFVSARPAASTTASGRDYEFSLAGILKAAESTGYRVVDDPVCVCVCIFIKLNITAQSGPDILLIVILCH